MDHSRTSCKSFSRPLMLALAMVVPSAPVKAVQATFQVSITLHSAAPAPQTGSCGAGGSHGDQMVAVVCHSGNFRFMAHLKDDELSLTGDGYVGTGTSTAWRVVNLPDRQYIEMTVGW